MINITAKSAFLGKKLFLSCVDYTVSQKTFELQECTGVVCFTSPRPQNSDLGAFYESDEYISFQYEKGLISRLYQSVHRTFCKSFKSLIPGKLKEAFLDIGCGTGEFECGSAERLEVRGIEPGEKARQAAIRELQTRCSSRRCAEANRAGIYGRDYHVACSNMFQISKADEELNSILKKTDC